ncbi:MAG: multiheme c-type cytochrome [Ignavibacteriota bacterium]
MMVSGKMRILALFALCAIPSALAAGAGDYVGSDACRPCHAANFASQSATSHARALARSTATQLGDWAFGAGLQAITFLTRIDGESYREDGLSWFRSLNGYAATPGHPDEKGIVFRTFDPAARILTCFACHSTGPVTIGKDEEVIPHELGVRCEVCHGPGASHVRDATHNRLRTPAQLSASAMNRFCGQCHRIDSESGEELTDLGDFRNARDQPVRLAASACFVRSNGRLNCITCHDPHRQVEQNAESYDLKCRNCHANPKHRQQVTAQACVTCHMPAIPNGPHLAFANHRIAVYAAGNPLVPASTHQLQRF